MTWSIVARDHTSGALGIAAATRFFAVGARVPFIASRVGAIATQGLVNPYYGIDGLSLLRAGHAPISVIEMVIAGDPGASHRQVHLMDAAGRIAAHTGRECLPWSGHQSAPGVSVAGNMLTGPEVLSATLAAYFEGEALPFQQRLVAAMRAGEAAGGDRRGKQSAALVIVGSDEWSVLDLRVDDHPDPLAELARLEEVSRREWMIYRQFVPTRSNPAGVTDHKTIDAAIGEADAEV